MQNSEMSEIYEHNYLRQAKPKPIDAHRSARISIDSLAREADCESIYSSQQQDQQCVFPEQPKPSSHTESLIHIKSNASPLFRLPIKKTDSRYSQQQPLCNPMTIRTQPVITSQKDEPPAPAPKDRHNSKSKFKNGKQEERKPQRETSTLLSLEKAVTKLEMRVEQARRELEMRNHRMKENEPENEVTTNAENYESKLRREEEFVNGESMITVKRQPSFSMRGEMREIKSVLRMDKNEYYVCEAVREVNSKTSLIKEHISKSMEDLSKLANEQPPKEYYPYSLPERPNLLNKTIVFELDQTIVHCADNTNLPCDAAIKVKGPQQRTINVIIRPFALTLLKELSSKFQLIIFTTLQRNCANSILDFIDPDGSTFQFRFYQQHCSKTSNGVFTKDMRILGRPLSEIVLVDCKASSFAFQLENGIPITPYYSGNQDFELKGLMSYLLRLQNVPDVRQVNKPTFKLQHYCKFDTVNELIEQLYAGNC